MNIKGRNVYQPLTFMPELIRFGRKKELKTKNTFIIKRKTKG